MAGRPKKHDGVKVGIGWLLGGRTQDAVVGMCLKLRLVWRCEGI